MKSERPSCEICHSTNFISRTNKVFGNKLLKCRNCGLTFAYPQLSFNDLGELYGESYFKNEKSHLCGYQDYLQDKTNIIKTFQRRIKKIQKLRPEGGKILDLGCAAGFFLEVAESLGWDVWGVDISDYAVRIAQQRFGSQIHHGTLESFDAPPESFDVITGWDYIEHVSHPDQELARMFVLLKRGGVLILSTPDIGSLPAKIMKDKWMGFKDTEHLYFFSKGTVRRMLEQNNFRVIKQEHVGKHVTLNLFIKRLALYNSFLAKGMSFFIPKNFLQSSLYVNPRDIICIYAEK